MYRLYTGVWRYTGVQAVYWCIGCILVYKLYTGVQAVYWCTGCILVFRLYTGVWAVCTSYYMLSVPYCVYCSRPEDAKRPRVSAVNKAIWQRERVVSGLLQNSHLEKYTVRLNSNTFLPLVSIFPVILFLFQENGLS